MYKFATSPDSLTKIITICVAALAVGLVITGVVTYYKAGRQPAVLIGSMLGPAIIVVLMIAMYLFRPRELQIDAIGITVDKMVKPRHIDFSEIISIRKAETGEMAGAIRTFGNGGLFGYTGLYYNRQLGRMRWFCTQRKNYVIIDTKNKKRIIITPDQPDDLLQTISTLHPNLATK